MKSNVPKPAAGRLKPGMLKSLTLPGSMLLVSALLHAALIAAIGFGLPELKRMRDNAQQLEVVLVNSKTQTRPEKADLLAQTNLDRGGNTEASRRMKTALPAQTKHAPARQQPVETGRQNSAPISADSDIAQAHQRVTELEQQTRALMTQLHADKAIETQAEQKSPAAPADTPASVTRPSRADLLANSYDTVRTLEMERLEAQIARQQDNEQKRPRRKYIGARTQEYRFTAYVEAWRQKVEKVGTLNYPEAAKDQKIYGQLRMTVSLLADGNIESIVINQSSGHKVLDDAARRIVEMGAPYAAFPEDLRKDTDVLSISRTWTFTRQDNLASE